MQSKWYKIHPNDKIWWLDNSGEYVGVWLFSFDREKIYNMFSDYPDKLAPEEKAIFDAENPYWKEFFADRQK